MLCISSTYFFSINYPFFMNSEECLLKTIPDSMTNQSRTVFHHDKLTYHLPLLLSLKSTATAGLT